MRAVYGKHVKPHAVKSIPESITEQFLFPSPSTSIWSLIDPTPEAIYQPIICPEVFQILK